MRFPGGFDVGREAGAAGDDFAWPRGAFFLVRLDGRAVGCGGVHRLDQRTAEIKRMWVDPLVRRRGVARRLLTELEATGRALGCERVRLDTSPHLDPAIALYRSSGYVAIDPYNDNPYAGHWFEKPLF